MNEKTKKALSAMDERAKTLLYNRITMILADIDNDNDDYMDALPHVLRDLGYTIDEMDKDLGELYAELILVAADIKGGATCQN